MTQLPPAPPLAAVAHCRDVTRHHSKTFYLGSRFFGPEERAAVWAVYAACRTGDDVVDERRGEAAERGLTEWWARVRA